MSDQTMRAAIKTRLEALGPAIGRVHDYERWNVSQGQFLNLFLDPATKKIFGWEIVRTGFRTERATMAKWKLVHHYLVRGYYALQDEAATEKTANAVLDMIVLDLTRTRLAGTQKDLSPEGKIQVRMFGNVLCHVAEIKLNEVVEIVAQLPEEGETDLSTVGFGYYLTPGDDQPAASDDLNLQP